MSNFSTLVLKLISSLYLGYISLSTRVLIKKAQWHCSPQHITGESIQSFHVECIEKVSAGKNKSILVRFLNEHNSLHILCHVHKLRNMQTEYPHVGIAPDHTKKKQERFRYLRNKCSKDNRKANESSLSMAVLCKTNIHLKTI